VISAKQYDLVKSFNRRFGKYLLENPGKLPIAIVEVTDHEENNTNFKYFIDTDIFLWPGSFGRGLCAQPFWQRFFKEAKQTG
jgi:hypothetical protein